MQKEKSIGRNILIVFLIIVMIASVCAALFAWAKYQTTINGTATGETAKWSFKVSDGNTSTQDIDFPITRTDSNTSVAEGKIAPGTYGEIEIGIDATGTETALTYVIEGTIENLPTNIKFYSDAERTLDLTVLNNKFSKGGYMKLNEVGVRAEKIYWEWPFETETKPTITEEKLVSLGINKTEFDALITDKKFAEANNMIDTAENEKQFSMSMSVTGKQLNGNPVLADLVQVGDYVNYDASSNGTKTFASTTLAGTSISGTFSSDDITKWRVLNIDREKGTVELMSEEPTANTVTLTAKDGYKNGKTILNNIGAIYGQGKGAVEGRSITLEDVEQYSNYDKTTFKGDGGYNVGDSKTYTSRTFIMEDGGEVEATEENPITVIQTYYYYAARKYFKNKSIYDMVFKKCDDTSINKTKYWLATNCIGLNSSYCNYCLHVVSDSYIGTGYLYNNAGNNKSQEYAVSVVVTLQDNIKTTGQDANGVWQLNVE